MSKPRRKINLLKMSIKTLLILVIAALLILGIPRLVTALYSIHKIKSVEDSPSAPVAIVFGAGLRRDGTPTLVLRDRVAIAAKLYFDGKVKKLLMSGDNRFVDYNEPGAMKSYALELGVPEKDIVLDYAGRRTYDTCYRAKYIFEVDSAVLVTQNFHQPRALFTCNMIGLPSTGVSADRVHYSAEIFWQIRELPATLVALFDTLLTHPLPVLGDKEPIFPSATPQK
jgi:SanA protein